MYLTASPCIFVAFSSHEQLFCTQRPLPSSSYSSSYFNHHRFSIKHCGKSRQGERERERKWVRQISSTTVHRPPGLAGHTVGVLYSKVYSFHGDQMKTNRALTKWDSNILKPSQSAWGVFLLSDRLFGKTDKHWTYCLTVCLSVCLSIIYARVIHRDSSKFGLLQRWSPFSCLTIHLSSSQFELQWFWWSTWSFFFLVDLI